MAEENSQKDVEFHYIKSNAFRVVHADGVWGGPTPRGYITMAFYSERAPIPQRLIQEITPRGTLGQETGRDSKGGVVREVDIEIMIDLDLAKNLLQWLEEKITVLEQRHSQPEEGK